MTTMNKNHTIVDSQDFKAAVDAMAALEKMHPRTTLDALLLVACEHLPLAPAINEASDDHNSRGLVDWSREKPDDTDADKAIAQAGDLSAAFCNLSSKYAIPLTAHENRWQDGQYLRSVGEFIEDVKNILSKFSQNSKAF